jgi:hypothetical protein
MAPVKSSASTAVLALGSAVSSAAANAFCSAGDEVDQSWQEHLNQAMAVLHTMREPDHLMAEAGDPHVWTRMVDAAIQDAE